MASGRIDGGLMCIFVVYVESVQYSVLEPVLSRDIEHTAMSYDAYRRELLAGFRC